MKRLFTLLFALSMVFVLAACNAVSGNGTVTTEEYDVSGFNRIEFDGVGDVVVTVGETESLTITTDENLQELMKAEVNGDTLNIGQKPNTSIMNPTELLFEVTVTSLEYVSLSGAGDMTIEALESDSFEVRISGAGDIILESLVADIFDVDISGAGDLTLESIEVEEFSLRVSGAGGVEVSGSADTLEVNISGAGSFSGFDLETVTADVNISGAGSARVNVSDTLDGSISGAGSIRYRGNPDVNVSESGVGDVSADN